MADKRKKPVIAISIVLTSAFILSAFEDFLRPHIGGDESWYTYNAVYFLGSRLKMNLTETQIKRAFNDFIRKRQTTEYLRMPPLDCGNGTSSNGTF